MKGRKIVTYNGTGALGPGHVGDGEGDDGATVELQGTHVVLASGSVPRTIPGFDVDGSIVLTSDEVLMLDQLPSSAVVIGGGAIGCEFASMMSDLGMQVTILEALPKILPGCDGDVAKVVVRSFKKRASTSAPVCPSPDTSPARRRHDRALRRGRGGARRPGRRVGGPPPVRRLLGLEEPR